MKIDLDTGESLKQIQAQASRIYMKSLLHKFREGKTRNDRELTSIPENIKVACTKFKSLKRKRCELAKTIWESNIGSRSDESRPLSSSISYLPPKVKLSRSQVLQLLGKPTIKVGYMYKWFCGKDEQGRAGVLIAVFNTEAMVSILVYGAKPLNYWIKK